MSDITIQKILNVITAANIVKDAKALELDKPLSEQGVDSLDFSGLLFSLEETLDILIPDEDVDGLLTINDIAIYIDTNK